MRHSVEQSVRRKVKAVYASIADAFDRTRRAPWAEFQDFAERIGKGDRVLDLGCGTGRLFPVAAERGAEYTGLDNNESLLGNARSNHPEGRFVLGDMIHLPFEDEAYDAVFCIASFHHLPGRRLRKEAAEEMRRVLKRDGILCLTVWNLFQVRYIGAWLRAMSSWILHAGMKYAWNDLWVDWKGHKGRRYYHAFLPGELKRYFPEILWETDEVYFSRKGNRVKFLQSFNLVLILRKR